MRVALQLLNDGSEPRVRGWLIPERKAKWNHSYVVFFKTKGRRLHEIDLAVKDDRYTNERDRHDELDGDKYVSHCPAVQVCRADLPFHCVCHFHRRQF